MFLNCQTREKIYYATRVKQLKAHRKGAAWVIHEDDVKAYHEQYLSNASQEKKEQAS